MNLSTPFCASYIRRAVVKNSVWTLDFRKCLLQQFFSVKIFRFEIQWAMYLSGKFWGLEVKEQTEEHSSEEVKSTIISCGSRA